MSIVRINYDCGCGFHGKTVEEAIAHVDVTGHTLNVAGSITPTERKVHIPRASSRISPLSTRRPDGKRDSRQDTMHDDMPLSVQQAEVSGDFSALRKRLQNKMT